MAKMNLPLDQPHQRNREFLELRQTPLSQVSWNEENNLPPAFEGNRISLQPEEKQPLQTATIDPQKGAASTAVSS
jgi:hypothetical protein